MHWQGCKRVLRYLKETCNDGLYYKAGRELKLKAYVDADWAADKDDRESIGGYCVSLGDNLVSWSAKKQRVVSKSGTEAEYRALSNGAAEIIWIMSLLNEFSYQIEPKTVIWCDNKSAIALAENPVFHGRTKHIEIDIHFLRDLIKKGQVEIKYIPGRRQVANIMTKALPYESFEFHKNKLRVWQDCQA